MKKKGVFIFVVLVVALGVCVGCILKFQERIIANLEDQIQYLEEEFVPMKFEIQERKNSFVSVKVKYYDMTGAEVGSSEVKLNGDELNFDFEVVKFSEKAYIFFPCGVYTDTMAMVDETKIFGDYDDSGFPKIYNGMQFFDKDGKALSKDGVDQVKEQLATYFAIACKGEVASKTEQHGVAVHDLKAISEFKKGFVYKVICHPHSGGIEIVAMK
jgi:hypothetical protein